MPKFTWLRSFGAAGSFIANAVVFLTTNWGVVASAVVALAAALWAGALQFFEQPRVQIGIGVFVATLWTYIGLVALYDRRRPRLVTPAPDYRYGLTFEGLVPNYNRDNEDAALQFGIQLRNFSAGPLRYLVQNFDVRIGTRSLPKLNRGHLTAIMPRGAGRVSSNIPFKRDDIKEFFGKKQITGTVDFLILYGHPEQNPVRQLVMSLALFLEFHENGMLGFNATIKEESDEPFKTP